MIQQVREFLETLALTSMVSSFLVIAGFIGIPAWRKNRVLGLVGFLLGSITLAAVITWQIGPWGLFAFVVAIFAGPWMIVFLADSKRTGVAISAMFEALTSVWKSKK
ncbi:MAG: hypothetical protein AAF720_00935 [Pseudomonadota bacterium]